MTNIIEELSDLELSLEAEKDENGKIRASWVKEFILISLSRRDKEWREKITKWAIGRLPAFPPKAIIKDFEELKLISVKDIEEFLIQSHLLNK